MGDMGDFWRDVKEHRRDIKQKRKDAMPDIDLIFNQNDVNYEVKNNGEHYIVCKNEKEVDYWPSTGRWKCRSKKKTGFSIRPLIKYLNKE